MVRDKAKMKMVEKLIPIVYGDKTKVIEYISTLSNHPKYNPLLVKGAENGLRPIWDPTSEFVYCRYGIQDQDRTTG